MDGAKDRQGELLKVLTEKVGFVLMFDCVPLLSGLFFFLGKLKYYVFLRLILQ